MSIGSNAVRKTLSIQATPEHAFHVFTDRIDAWWPRKHHIGESPLKREVLEPKVGGRWYGLSEDGSECEVGKVLAWDPPHRLLLAWQITGEWKYDPAFITEVEVRFTAEDGGCRMDFEHRNLDRYGKHQADIAKAFESPDGWLGSLQAICKLAEQKNHYMIRLVPPRPSFAMDMDAREKALMGEHIGYWREEMARGSVLVFGPVMDPKGPFGLGVVRFESEARLQAFIAGDPTVIAGLNAIEYHAMRAVYPGQ